MLLIFLDTETTGLNPEKHRTLEIAYKIFDTITEHFLVEYEALVSQPEAVWAEADPRSLEVNGFTWEETLQGKTEKAIAAEIANDFNSIPIRQKSAVFVCQNPSFDRAFFNQLIPSYLQDQYRWPYHWLDLASMYWACRMLKDKTSAKQLKEEGLSKDRIAEFYGIPPEGHPHRALRGVDHLIACYQSVLGNT